MLLRALGRIEREGAEPLANALDTPAQKVQTLATGIEDLQIAFGDLALPSYIRLVEQLTDAVEDATTEVNLWKDGTDGLGRAIDKTKLEIKEFLNENVRTAIDLLPVAKELTDLFSTSVDQLTGSFINAIPGLNTFNALLQTYLKARGLLEDFANTPQVPQAYSGMEDMSGDPILPTNRPTVVDHQQQQHRQPDRRRIDRRGFRPRSRRPPGNPMQDQLLERLETQVAIEKNAAPCVIELQTLLELQELEQDITNRELALAEHEQLDRDVSFA